MQKLIAPIILICIILGCKKPPVQDHPTPTTKTFRITASSGGNGSVDPAGMSVVASGSDATYTIIPTVNYGISTLTVDSVVVPIVDGPNTYTFTNVQKDHTIGATFAPFIKITVTTDGYGTARFSPAKIVAGQTVTFTFAPKLNYLTDSLYVGGKFLKLLAGATTFTLSNVNSDQTIAVTFSITTKGIDSLRTLLAGSWHYVQYDYQYTGTTKWIIAPYLTDCEKARHEVYTADYKYTYFMGGTSCDPSYAPTNIYFDGTWKFDATAKNILLAGNQYTNATNYEYTTGNYTLEKLTPDSLVISYLVPGKGYSYRFHYGHK
jgi:hypothetical protein